MAWLNATPKPPPGSKRAETADKTPSISRIDKMKRDKIVPPMPPNPMPHMITRLVEIGLSESNGMGASPLSWREINEWQQAAGVDLAPWEARLMRTLSLAYLAESRKAESETCPPPWHAPVTQREIETEQARLQMVLG
ncbi:phage tail assembly chaperone [Sphingomonas sp. PB4P5]|uniref:phage tail assembly chaperone n=1 Tax=Parasphingomonas puruogangriensis TaxID=3096155 RepID=UPI002FCAF490